MEGGSADQAARRSLEDNEAIVAVSATQAGSALNDAQNATGRYPREPVERGAPTKPCCINAFLPHRC
jgi:hypothetical protein